jgi:nucleoside-diphosphate-sugar epimerase
VEQPPGDEQTELKPVYEYGRSKVEAEKVVREESENLGLNHIILRPTGTVPDMAHNSRGRGAYVVWRAGVLGPGDFFTIYELMEMINSGLLCFIPGSGQAQLMYTHVDGAYRRALETGEAALF